MRTGLDRNTGEVLTGWAECVQSIGTVVETAIGSLVLARDFGSGAPVLQDRPQSRPSIMDQFMAVAEGVRRWEPGYALRKLGAVQLGDDGVAGFDLAGDYYPNGHLGDFSLVEPARSVRVMLAGTGLSVRLP